MLKKILILLFVICCQLANAQSKWNSTTLFQQKNFIENFTIPELSNDEIQQLGEEQRRFLEDSRRATTDTAVRQRRTNYLIDLIVVIQKYLYLFRQPLTN